MRKRREEDQEEEEERRGDHLDTPYAACQNEKRKNIKKTEIKIKT